MYLEVGNFLFQIFVLISYYEFTDKINRTNYC